jgi:hypothetical protein
MKSVDPHLSGCGLEIRFEDERIRAYRRCVRRTCCFGAQQPAPVVRRAEQRAEARCVVESRHAHSQSIEPVATDQGGSAQIADQRVVFDGQGHGFRLSRILVPPQRRIAVR